MFIFIVKFVYIVIVFEFCMYELNKIERDRSLVDIVTRQTMMSKIGDESFKLKVVVGLLSKEDNKCDSYILSLKRGDKYDVVYQDGEFSVLRDLDQFFRLSLSDLESGIVDLANKFCMIEGYLETALIYNDCFEYVAIVKKDI